MRASTRLLLLALLLGSGVAALADDKAPSPRPEQLVELGFKYRRDGELAAASAALDEAVKVLPEKSAERRTVLLELYDVAWVESKWDRAARLMRNVDPVREVRAFLKAGRGPVALECGRVNKDLVAEGVALRGLARNDEALAVLAKAGAAGAAERADLLFSLGRFADAAKDYETAGDLFQRALSQEKAGVAVDWKPVIEDVKKKVDALVAKGDAAKKTLEGAQGLVAKERARHALAALLDQTSREYERSSVLHEKTNDRPKALRFLELAIQSSEEGRRALTDSNRDRYGDLRMKQLGLTAREDALLLRARALRR